MDKQERQARFYAELQGAQIDTRDLGASNDHALEITIRPADGQTFRFDSTSVTVGTWGGARELLAVEFDRIAYALAERFTEGQRLHLWIFGDITGGPMWRDVVFVGPLSRGNRTANVQETFGGYAFPVHVTKLCAIPTPNFREITT